MKWANRFELFSVFFFFFYFDQFNVLFFYILVFLISDLFCFEPFLFFYFADSTPTDDAQKVLPLPLLPHTAFFCSLTSFMKLSFYILSSLIFMLLAVSIALSSFFKCREDCRKDTIPLMHCCM